MLSKSYVKDYRKNIEVVSFKEKVSKIRGLVTVELFDAATKKKVLEAKTENLITSIGYNFLRNQLITSALGLTYTGSKPSFENVFSQIQLYSGNEPEIEEKFPSLGDLVGWSNQTTYSGSDTLRGTVNTAETRMNYDDLSRVHFVFDWPTNAANGTFQTIIWGSRNLLPMTMSTVYVTFDLHLVGVAGNTQDLYVLGYQNNKIYQLDPNTFTVIRSFSTPGTYPRGLAWDGTNIWSGDASSNKIYKINPSDGTVLSSFSFSNPYGIAWDGTYLWVTTTADNKIYKLDPNSGTVLSSFTGPTTNFSMPIAHDQQNLYIYDGSAFYKIDPTTGTVKGKFYSNFSCSALTWDGEKFISVYNSVNNSTPISTIYNVNYGARTLLASPVTKTSTNTMKIQYDFVFQE
ncbi:DKNYY domain-containing protein [Thermoanaerobacterium thermosaccharolyticum]|uniref:Vgb family protein n=1 Tax=Thermoanaerobacterium thermosaccharolyticum TaxID=1517 RepID=UPI003DA96F69